MPSTPEHSARPTRRRAVPAIRAFVRGASGATMVEYALLLGAVALIGVVGAKQLGGIINIGAGWVANVIRTS